LTSTASCGATSAVSCGIAAIRREDQQLFRAELHVEKPAIAGNLFSFWIAGCGNLRIH